jgi:bacteriocin biosynthesis cyclodehydratase domain-containing protein
MYHLIVTPVGPFGLAVADRLGDLCADVEIAGTPGAVVRPRLPEPQLNLLIAWRRVPRREREFDEQAFRTGRPWLPVTLDHPVLEIGPVVVPGVGPCHACYRTRMSQHDPGRDFRALVDAHYDENPSDGPAGYLPSTALLAASAIADVAVRLQTAPEKEAGRVRRLDVPSQAMWSGHVVGVHGCARCGLGRDSYDRPPALLKEVGE